MEDLPPLGVRISLQTKGFHVLFKFWPALVVLNVGARGKVRDRCVEDRAMKELKGLIPDLYRVRMSLGLALLRRRW